MFKTFALSCLAAAVVNAKPDEEKEFLQWAAKEGKSYKTTEEFAKREKLWSQSKKDVDELNANPDSKARFALNFLSDLDDDELRSKMGNLEGLEEEEGEDRRMLEESREGRRLAIAGAIDWRDEGKLTSIKDQG